MHSADLADAVSRLRRAMRRAARAADPGSGLSVAQLEMLSCMAENPGSRPGQLARLLRLAPSSVATLSNSLRQSGLVTRTGGEGDRRTASLDLTPAGEAAVLRWKSLNERLLSVALRELPPDSRVTLLDALPALADLAGAVDALADDPSATGPLTGETSLADDAPAAARWPVRPRWPSSSRRWPSSPRPFPAPDRSPPIRLVTAVEWPWETSDSASICSAWPLHKPAGRDYRCPPFLYRGKHSLVSVSPALAIPFTIPVVTGWASGPFPVPWQDGVPAQFPHVGSP